MLVCISFCTIAGARPRVQRAPGLPCALLISEGAGRLLANLGELCREIANAYPAVIVRHSRSKNSSRFRSPTTGRPSIPETPMIESRGCGVLGPRMRGDDKVHDGTTYARGRRPGSRDVAHGSGRLLAPRRRHRGGARSARRSRSTARRNRRFSHAYRTTSANPNRSRSTTSTC